MTSVISLEEYRTRPIAVSTGPLTGATLPHDTSVCYVWRRGEKICYKAVPGTIPVNVLFSTFDITSTDEQLGMYHRQGRGLVWCAMRLRRPRNPIQPSVS